MGKLLLIGSLCCPILAIMSDLNDLNSVIMTLHDGAQQPTASSVRSFFHRITPEKSRLIKEKVLFYSV